MKLGLNIDHIATIRQARGGFEPNPLTGAIIAEIAGADGITMHLREDRRHIQDADVYNVKKNIQTRLNLEMAATEEMQKIALDIMPHFCCIVPEKREELTTEGGLNVFSQKNKLKEFIKPLKDNGILVSLFIDPDEKQIEATLDIGAPFIELHTGGYAHAFNTKNEENELNKLKTSANIANKEGVIVNAGHGLNYQNVHKIKEIENLYELNIGHSIISRAVFVGLDSAIKEMIGLIN